MAETITLTKSDNQQKLVIQGFSPNSLARILVGGKFVEVAADNEGRIHLTVETSAIGSSNVVITLFGRDA